MKKLFSRRGFTLTETLISLVVLLILAGVASAVMMSGFGVYGRTALRNSAQEAGDTVYELISSRLTYAVDLTISDDVRYVENNYDVQAEGSICIYIPTEGDRVGMGAGALAPGDVLRPSQLKGLRIEVSAEYQSEDLVGLTVGITSEEDGRMLYSRTGTIRLMNAADPAIDSFCDIQNCDNSVRDMYFVFNELA